MTSCIGELRQALAKNWHDFFARLCVESIGEMTGHGHSSDMGEGIHSKGLFSEERHNGR